MALGMLAIGISGIIAMQKVTVIANRDAKNLEIANQIAHTWIERLRADSMLWNSGTDLATDTMWINNPYPPTQPTWIRPQNTNLGIYGVHDALGVDDASGVLNGPFCVHLRLTTNTPSSIRAEVRVYWMRQGTGDSTQTVEAPLCGGTAAAAPDVQSKTELYHFVHVTTALMQNPPY